MTETTSGFTSQTEASGFIRAAPRGASRGAGERAARRRRGLDVFRPDSIFQLLLTGFGLAVIPLVAAIVTAAVYVDRVTAQGQEAIYDAVANARNSQALLEQLVATERSARQYHILGDRALYDVYLDHRAALVELLRALNASRMDAEQRHAVAELTRREEALHERMKGLAPSPENAEVLAHEYAGLSRLVKEIQGQSNASVAQNAQALNDAAARAHYLLTWLAAVLVPLVSVIASYFVYLISRPLKQLDHAIRNLGAGGFDKAILVKGPRDVRELGERLDWMRVKLQELQSQKVTFLRHMSHELKTPLASLREGSELLKEGIVGPLNREQREVADLMSANSRRLQRMIEDLLNFSTLQSTHPLLDARPVELAALAEEVAQDRALEVRGRNLRLETQADPGITVMGDRDKLRTIIDNLLSNAIKFSPEGGRLQVTIEGDEHNAVLEVEDEGPGIPLQEREQVFDAFYQGSNQPESHVKGSGLGLSMAREYARTHDGEVELVDTEAGTVFRLTLPRAGQS